MGVGADVAFGHIITCLGLAAMPSMPSILYQSYLTQRKNGTARNALSNQEMQGMGSH